jgi:hypothetical protein
MKAREAAARAHEIVRVSASTASEQGRHFATALPNKKSSVQI